jgi:ATP:ADP antiporter, AAA family
MTTAPPAPAGRPSIFDRLLRPFTDVRPGEGSVAALMLLSLFLLFIGYYVLKTVREPLILASGRPELASYSAAGQAVVLIGFIPLFGWLASRVPRLKLVAGTIGFFIVCIELFYLAVAAQVPYVGVAFYVWLGIYNNATVALFWSFANDVYTREAGARLFPMIAIGATAGSPLGSLVAGQLFDAGVKGHQMFHITAALLVVHLVLYVAVDRRQPQESGAARVESPPPLPGPGGFALTFRSPYIRLIALLLVVLNLVNSNGEYLVRRYVNEAAAGVSDKAAFIGSFFGQYQFWVAVGAMVLQVLVVSRIVKHLGIAGVVLIPAFLSLGNYGLTAAGAAFAVFRWTKTAENASDYSIMNTAKQMLWLPTSRAEKYKAKQAVDTFFVRLGDVASAAAVFAGVTWLGLGVRGFGMLNTLFVAVWLAIGFQLLKEHRRLAGESDVRAA